MKLRVVSDESDVHATVSTFRDWRERMAHKNARYVKNFLKQANVEVLTEKDFFCESCVMGKMHRTPFPKSTTKASEVGELVHADLCGPMQDDSVGDSRYFLLLKDDYSHMKTVYFVKQKSEVKDHRHNFLKRCEKTLPRGVQTLRTDNGLEFKNLEVRKLTKSLGVKHEKTVPYSPEQNRAAERENRTIIEAARTLLFAKKLSTKLWTEAVNTAVHVLNKIGPSIVKGIAPYELWHGKPPDISYLRVFGEEIFTHIPKEKRRKGDHKAEQGFLFGYDDETKNYRVWFEPQNRIKICRDVKFSGRQSIREIVVDNEYTLLKMPWETKVPKDTKKGSMLKSESRTKEKKQKRSQKT